MGDSYDLERLRHELGQYGDLKASGDERSIQALIGELIHVTRTDPSDESGALETDAASGTAEREDHSIERAAAHLRDHLERVPSGAVAQAPSAAEDAQQDTPAAHSRGSEGSFSRRRWAVVCASVLILIGTVTGGLSLLWGGGPRNGELTTVSVPPKLEQPFHGDDPSGPAPVKPDVSEGAPAAERIQTAAPAPAQALPQPVPSTETAEPAPGQPVAEISTPPGPALTTTRPVPPKPKKRSTSRRRAPQPTRLETAPGPPK